MSFPTSEPIPAQHDPNSAAARRRRWQRSLTPQTDDERAGWLATLARQLTPSYDFFLACLLAGVVLAIALLLSSDALLVLGILFAPFLGPVIGIALGATNGSFRFLIKSILSVAAAVLFIFGFGALAGALLPLLPLGPRSVFTAWNTMAWPSFLVIAVGVGLSVFMLVRSPRQRPLVASVAIAYGLFPPLTAAGFNLVVFHDSAWIVGLTVAGVYLAWAILFAIVMLIIMGYPPRNLGGFLITGSLIGVLAAAFVNSGSIKGLDKTAGPVLLPTQPAITVPVNLSPTPTITQTSTPQPPAAASATVTLTPTITFAPTSTATETITPQPTPIWARVTAPTGGGALLRDEPDGKIVSSILNGGMVQVISDPVRGTTSTIWVQVRTEDGLVGWIVQSLLATATPAPGW